MRKAKKLLVTLLVLTFVMSTFSVGFAATTTDTKDLPTEVVRAMALGYLKGDAQGNLNLENPITRAEALAIIIRVSGLETSAELMKGQTKFADVNPDPSLEWATGYINLGVGQGIINGYPDGTFRGNANVTYAEMAKMILYAMNYGVTVEGAPWPAGVMGKADDLGLFDKVSSSPDAPAIRGDVVKMIDNSLTIKHLEQTGYGDLKQYVEGDKTFLSKMDVDEIDGRVTDIDVKNCKITVTPDDDETDISKPTTYKLLDETIDVDSLLGVPVTVWANDDDEIFFIDIDMDDVKIDVIDSIDDIDDNKIGLKIADKNYKFDEDDIEVYINGDDAEVEDLKVGMYGYFVFEDNKILYINVKEWNEVEAGLVKEVEDNLITYYDGSSESDIDLEDPDDGYFIILNGEAIEADDIAANDVIYVAEYDDIYHIVVVRNTVEGNLERIKADQVKIDDKTYDVNDLATFSPDENDNIYDYDVEDSKLEDMLGEDVVAILDIGGDVRHLMSDVETISDDFYGILLKVDDYNETVKVNVAGSSTSYEIDTDADIVDKADIKDENDDDIDLSDLSTLKEYANDSKDKYAIVGFTLDKDGVINEMTVYAVAEATKVDGKITGWNVKPESMEAALESFDDKDDIISTASKHYLVDDDTVIIDELDDIDVVKWDNIKDKTFGNGVKAIIVADGNDAKLVVFTAGFDQIQKEDKELGVVLDKFKDKDGDWAATVSVYGGKEVDYKLDKKTAQDVGNVVLFTIDADDELSVSARVYGPNANLEEAKSENPDIKISVESGKVSAKSSSSISIGDDKYSTSSKTLFFDVTDGFADIDTAAYRDIKTDGTTKVALIIEKDLVKIVYILEQD